MKVKVIHFGKNGSSDLRNTEHLSTSKTMDKTPQKDESDIDSDTGGMSSGEEEEIDAELLNGECSDDDYR